MTENQNNAARQIADDDEINLLDLLLVLARNKAMIIKVTFAAALLASGAALMLDNIYTGTAKILPPQQNQSAASMMMSQLGGLASLAGGSLGIKNPNDLYVAMLQSRNVMEKVAKRFDLQKIYEEDNLTETLKVLDKSLEVISGKDGVITVEVDDEDPKRAADMANAFIEELNKLMQTFSLTDAAQKRTFFEQQLRQAKDKLTDAEIRLDRTLNTSLQYLDAVRNLKYQEAVWEILARQYEMSKLDEAKDYPLIQVLDKATPPEKKTKPKRSLIVVLAMLIAFFLAVIWAFIREGLSQVGSDPEQTTRLHELRRSLRWKA
jgi:uncharacterized protein involved in exopolysaccharide biosynthesis